MKQILLILALFWPALASGTEIYRYIDKSGAVHFSDQPPDSRSGRAAKKSSSIVPLPKPSKIGNSSLIRIYKYVDAKGNVHLAGFVVSNLVSTLM
ncbi:MAG: DUF4124 domain-containing protein, partial [Pseudomonadota bacterium]